MYANPTVLTAGALRLLQLVLNPFLTAGLQSAAYPSNGLPYSPGFPGNPPRQLSGSVDLSTQLGTLSSMGTALPPSGTVAPGTMTMAAVQAMPPPPYAPWLFAQPLPAVASTSTGPVYVPPSVVPSLLPGPPAVPVAVAPQQSALNLQSLLPGLLSVLGGQGGQRPSPSVPIASSALSTLEDAVAPYLKPSPGQVGSSGSDVSSSSDVASPMPMATLLSVLSSLFAGIRVVVTNFAASAAVMTAAQLVRIAVQNLPIILNIFGLTRAYMARVIVEGVTRAQCLEHAACVMGQHAASYQSTPDVLRWFRSPDPSAASIPEHPVWRAFRTAAEGGSARCDMYTC